MVTLIRKTLASRSQLRTLQDSAKAKVHEVVSLLEGI
jgi:hypothetical protein